MDAAGTAQRRGRDRFPRRPMSQRRTASVVILGTGAIAQVVHLPILTRMRGVEVVGIFDLDHAKATTLARRFAVPRVYQSAEEIWDDDAVDAVVICTPNNVHEEQVVQGLATGRYVFCERPLALTEKGTARVIRAAKKGGRLMVGMNQRFRPDASALKSFLAAGELGEIQYLRAGWLNRRMTRSPRSWRLLKTGAGGGALMDLGIQMLDLSLWLLGFPEPLRLVAHLHSMPGSDVEDSAILLLEVTDGMVINLEATWSLVADREREYLQVIGNHGSGSFPPLRVFKDTENGLLDVSPQIATSRENQFTASYRQELAHFVEAVRAEQLIQTPSDQITLMKIVEGAYRSAEKRSEIKF
jgi:predicted dehydrogenase